MRGRQPSTSWKVSLVSWRNGDCWSSCQAGADIMTSDVAPKDLKVLAISSLNAAMSASMKLRVWVEIKRWSSSVVMRPTLFDVSTVPGIASLIFTTPCGVCSRHDSRASTASAGSMVCRGSHFSMLHVMWASLGNSSCSHWFIISCWLLTNSAVSPEGTQTMISPEEAMEALASPMLIAATSKSYSFLIAARMAHIGMTAEQRPLLMSTPE